MVEARLEAFPKLTAVRLFKEIKAPGYPGGYSQVKRYVREARPRPAEEPVVRFETEPGHQGQVDFATFQLPWGRRYALLVALGYSRVIWGQFYARQTMGTLMRGLEAAFAYFGGVPHELLFDQMKAVVIGDARSHDRRLIENGEFQRFAHHWSFRMRACRPYRRRPRARWSGRSGICVRASSTVARS
jgi:transposase